MKQNERIIERKILYKHVFEMYIIVEMRLGWNFVRR